MPRYMIVETHFDGCLDAVYDRFHARGRMLPQGLSYIDSWPEKDGNRCFQLMETENPGLFKEWIKNWSDLTSFEIIEIGTPPGPKKAL